LKSSTVNDIESGLGTRQTRFMIRLAKGRLTQIMPRSLSVHGHLEIQTQTHGWYQY